MHYEPTFHVVLHQPEIPYNAGNVGRTCVAVGAKLWLVRPLGFQITDYYLRRAAMDYWQRLEWEAVDDWQDIAARLGTRRTWYFSKTGRQAYGDVQYAPGDVLAFGCESRGLPKDLLAQNEETTVRIPHRAAVRCLNLSNSVAIASYEVVRQLSLSWPRAIDLEDRKGHD
jgi:tRNA (cytidine/uridine-2'-O-)-methyltransferase